MAQRWVWSGAGLFLVVYWLLPPSVYNRIREDWNQDFSIFFLSGALVVTGAVLLVMNNAPTILALLTATLGRIRPLTPIVKSAVSYPLRFGFRTGLSLAMFAVVIFSVTVMATLIEGFNQLFSDQERLGGGYAVIGFARSDLNPVVDLSATVEEDPDLSFVSKVNGKPSVGTFRTFYEAEARLSEDSDGDFLDTVITGADNDFIDSNRFSIKLATAAYATESGFDSKAVWRDLRDKPGLAVVNAFLVPTRNSFNFAVPSDSFSLAEVDNLYIENETMDPVRITVKDLKSGASFDLTVIAALDDFASQNPAMPFGFFTSTNTLTAEIPGMWTPPSSSSTCRRELKTLQSRSRRRSLSTRWRRLTWRKQ